MNILNKKFIIMFGTINWLKIRFNVSDTFSKIDENSKHIKKTSLDQLEVPLSPGEKQNIDGLVGFSRSPTKKNKPAIKKKKSAYEMRLQKQQEDDDVTPNHDKKASWETLGSLADR